ncbi:hypothetical protein ES705_46331 [subsurface metagenome]
MHKCPNCGEPTEGSFSLGGINFAICEECYEKKYKKQEQNEAIHRARGVDGWQEVYDSIDAPSEEECNEEMAEDDRE